MKIQITDRDGAERFTCDAPWAAISISTYTNRLPNISPINRIGLCQVVFADVQSFDHLEYINSFSPNEEKAQIFSYTHAEKIITFFKDVKDKIDILLIHCEAGFSRSPAVGAALTKLFLGDDSEFFKKYSPNLRVYKGILKWEKYLSTLLNQEGNR